MAGDGHRGSHWDSRWEQLVKAWPRHVVGWSQCCGKKVGVPEAYGQQALEQRGLQASCPSAWRRVVLATSDWFQFWGAGLWFAQWVLPIVEYYYPPKQLRHRPGASASTSKCMDRFKPKLLLCVSHGYSNCLQSVYRAVMTDVKGETYQPLATTARLVRNQRWSATNGSITLQSSPPLPMRSLTQWP